MRDQESAVAQIRSFNRFYTHILGLLDRHILASDFSLTEARVLLEISKNCGIKAHDLAARLGVDRSYLSRILKRFETMGLMTRTPCGEDGRAMELRATGAAEATLAELSRRSDAQALSLIQPLSPEALADVLDAMALIRESFSQAVYPATLRGYRPGDEDYVIRRHTEIYRREYGLNDVFASFVEQGVLKLTGHLNPERECFVIPEIGGQPMGSIAIGDAGDQTAQLRYFLLEPEARGYGLGSRLVAFALDFARKAGYRRIFLETISALTTARDLYHRAGFRLVHAERHADWGPEVEEERWEMEL